MKKFSLSGHYTHKSFKVSGITTAFDKGASVEEAMIFGRWRNTGIPNLYYNSSKEKRMKVSKLNT